MQTFLLVFSVFAFVGFVVGVVNTWDATLDLRVLRMRHVEDDRRHIARMQLRTQSTRMVECLLLLIVALAALLQMPGEVRRLLSTVNLTIVSALIIQNSIADRISKSRLVNNGDDHRHRPPLAS